MIRFKRGGAIRFLPSVIVLLVILGLTDTGQSQFSWPVTLANHNAGLAFSPGIYSSYGSAFFSIQNEEQVFIYNENEANLYTDLFLISLNPTHILTELTIYPTSAFSGWLKTEHFSFYRKFDLIDDLNLWSSLAGNYQEPWSISLFFGQLANYVTLTDSENLAVSATGASGFVITTGWQEIFDGYLLKANWWRCEWKIKGTGKDRNKTHSWDIKIGYRWYGRPEITNTLNLTFSRQKTEKGTHSWNFHRNSCMEIEFQIPPAKINTGCSRLTFAYGKFLPFRKYLIGLKIGYSYEHRPEYRGPDKGFTPENRIIKGLVFQPVVEF